jgi:hypothetical protein
MPFATNAERPNCPEDFSTHHLVDVLATFFG